MTEDLITTVEIQRPLHHRAGICIQVQEPAMPTKGRSDASSAFVTLSKEVCAATATTCASARG
jgi:hypothetical protein